MSVLGVSVVSLAEAHAVCGSQNESGESRMQLRPITLTTHVTTETHTRKEV